MHETSHFTQLAWTWSNQRIFPNFYFGFLGLLTTVMNLARIFEQNVQRFLYMPIVHGYVNGYHVLPSKIILKKSTGKIFPTAFTLAKKLHFIILLYPLNDLKSFGCKSNTLITGLMSEERWGANFLMLLMSLDH